MPVFFINKSQIQKNSVKISGELLKHLRDSLRLQEGEKIFCVDEDGLKYEVETTYIGKDSFTGNILGKFKRKTDPSVHIHLAQSLPKGSKVDIIIQKATELGVNTITPVISERSIVRLEEKRSTEKVKRWNKIAIEAAQQSGRRDIPDITPPVTFKDFLSSFTKCDLNLLLWEGEEKKGIKSALRSLPAAGSVLILTGPEGGFTEKEVEMAIEQGFTTVSLGELTLRTETAPLTALSIVQYELGYMR